MQGLKMEIWKAFHNRGFLLASLIGLIAQSFNLGYNIWYAGWVEENSLPGADIGTAFSLFLRWISVDGWTLSYTLFVILFPLLAVMPFGWSLFSEKRSGYQNQMLCRERKTAYFTAKYVAVFLSGGSVIALTLLANLFLNALILPAHTAALANLSYIDFFKRGSLHL